jgi:hypothetical protein
MPNNDDNRSSKVWIPIKSFRRDVVVVQVTQLQGYRPRYSIEVGRINEDGKIRRHFGIFTLYELGSQVKIRESLGKTIASLVEEAEDWIVRVTQEREEQILEERITSEEKEANRGKPVTRQTGKTQKEREKLKSKA